MTQYLLRNGVNIDVVPYKDEYAIQIAETFSEGVSAKQVKQGRKELLVGGPDEAFSVCALHDSRVIGVCSGVRRRWFGEKHRVELVQVVVSEKYRRFGVAKFMVREIAAYFAQKGVEIIEIRTEESNQAAIAAYQRMGFRRYGYLEEGLKFGQTVKNEVLMAMKVATALALS